MQFNSSSQKSNLVQSQGVQRTSTFGIVNNGHMFNILSSGLYSDKITAVLREIGCNAADAHIAKGIADIPFEVKLPTSQDRTFYIKDFGYGLDDDEIHSIYTIYGVSTKQDCAEQTGGFGLGSKSPFAYTLNGPNSNGFSITSAKAGVQRTYVAYINEEGAPCVSLLDERPASDEWPSGVQVQFTVEPEDISEFAVKAVNVFQWFTTIPRILGNFSTIQSLKYQIEGASFGLNPMRVTSSSTEPCNPLNPASVIMANVAYPLELAQLSALSPELTCLIEGGICLKANNGDVMMTPSRESLQYTEDTRHWIKNQLVQSLTELVKLIHSRISDPTLLPFQQKTAAFRLIQNLPPSIFKKLRGIILRASVDLATQESVAALVSQPFEHLPSFVGRTSNKSPLPATPQNLPLVWMVNSTGRLPIHDGYVPKKQKGEFVSVRAELKYSDDSIIVYDDGTTYAMNRIKHYLQQHSGSTVIYFNAKGRLQPGLTEVKAQAEQLANHEGLRGLKTYSVGQLPLDSAKANQRALLNQRKHLNSDSLLEVFGEVSIKLFQISTGNIEVKKLKELTPSENFYTFYNHKTLEFYSNSERSGNLFKSKAKHLLPIIASHIVNLNANSSTKYTNPTAIILVPSKSELNRLHLLKLGAQAYIPFIRQVFLKNWDIVAQNFNTSDSFKTQEICAYSNSHLILRLAKYFELNSKLVSEAISELNMQDVPILQELRTIGELVVESNRSKADVQSKYSQKLEDMMLILSFLCKSLSELQLLRSTITRSHSLLSSYFTNRYPGFRLITTQAFSLNDSDNSSFIESFKLLASILRTIGDLKDTRHTDSLDSIIAPLWDELKAQKIALLVEAV